MKVGQIDEQTNYQVNAKSASTYDYCLLMSYILYILCPACVYYIPSFIYAWSLW